MQEREKQTEEIIFEAATEVFQEKGFDGTRMHDIAQRAGINKALLHYYFRTKDALFDAVFRKLATMLLSKFTPVFSPGLSLEDKLNFFFGEHIEFLRANPRLPLFIMNEINRRPERVKKLLDRINLNDLFNALAEQHRQELEDYNITPEVLPQIITSIAAISIFPFIARPVVEIALEKTGMNFNEYIERRKAFAPDFVSGALKSRKKLKKE